MDKLVFYTSPLIYSFLLAALVCIFLSLLFNKNFPTAFGVVFVAVGIVFATLYGASYLEVVLIVLVYVLLILVFEIVKRRIHNR